MKKIVVGLLILLAAVCWGNTPPEVSNIEAVQRVDGSKIVDINNENRSREEIKLLASDGQEHDQFGVSVSISGDYAIIGAKSDDDNGSGSGSAYIYQYNGTTWVEQQKLTASDGEAYDQFGYSVSIAGDLALIGAWEDDDNGYGSGSAYIYQYNGTTWVEQQKLTASDGNEFDNFGYSVSISGDHALIGAYGDDDNGSAYIYHYNGTTWEEQQKLTASDGQADDSFGISVSIAGDHALIGAYLDNDNGINSGSAYIYHYNGTSWVEQQKLTASDGEFEDRYGFTVSIADDHALIGAFNDDDNGSAYIYHYNGTSWVEQQKLTASDGESEDSFGFSVSIAGDHALIGAYGDDDNGINSGSAYIYHYNGTSWVEQQKLTASDGEDSDNFGRSVSFADDHALIGAYLDDDTGDSSGSAYIYNIDDNGSSLAADFEVDNTVVILGENLQFNDLSQGNITSWEWDFENDGTIESYEQNPQWLYEDVGYYSVSLTVANISLELSDTIIKENYIEVVEPLIADFSADVTQGTAPLEVEFTDETNGFVLERYWDFDNDGVVDSNEQNPVWTYEEPGIYTISLEVIDAYQTDNEIKENYIVVTEELAADFEADNPIAVLGDQISFTDLSSGNPTNWEWDFDNDGFIDSYEQNPVFIYPESGNYSVSLATSNSYSNDEELKIDYITILDSIIVDFIVDTTFTSTGNPLEFTDLTTGNPISWEWDFDNDGTIDSNDQNPTYAYQSAGIYTVKLYATDGYSSGIEIKSDWIEIYETAISDFEADNTITLLGDQISFTDLSSGNPTNWEWDFDNDGFIDSYEQNPVFIYPESGNYSVSLATSNSYSNDEELKIDYITVLDSIVVDFTVNNTFTSTGNPLEFTDLTTGNPISWEWDFDNDGSIDSNDQNPAYAYQSPGIYTVKLYATDGYSSGIEIKSDWIEIYETVISDFEADNPITVLGDQISFTDLSSGNPTNWEWDFDNDGSIDSYEQNPVFIYPESGNYSVSLATSHNYSNDEELKIDYITILDSIIVDFTVDTTLTSTGNPLEFTDLTTGNPISWEWDFDNDGTIDSYDQNPTYAYQSPGIYTVKLYATDGYSSGIEIKSDCIEIYEIVISDFFAANRMTLLGDQISFTDLSSGNPTNWEWDFDNDGSIDSYEQNPVFVYPDSGSYSVSLNVYGNHNSHQTVKLNYIEVNIPGLIANFPFEGNAEDVSGNGYICELDGQTLTADRFGNENSAYQFSGNNIQTNINWSEIITANSEFHIVVWFKTDTENDMCIFGESSSSSITNIYLATLNGGSSKFRLKNGGLCGIGINPYHNWHMLTMGTDGSNKTISVDDLIIPDMVDFGDDLGENIIIGGDNYASLDNFTGIIDDVLIYNHILSENEINSLLNQANPQINAEFCADDTEVTLGQYIQFTDLSTGEPTAWEWDFDNDGSIDSYEQNPEFIYTAPGTYTVSLTVTDESRQNLSSISLSLNNQLSKVDRENSRTVSTEIKIDYITVYNTAPYIFNSTPDFDFDEDTIDQSIDLSTVFGDSNTGYGDSLHFSFSGNTQISVVISESGNVTLTPEIDWFGSETITFFAIDSFGESASDAVVITVNGVNDPPILNITGNFEAEEDLVSQIFDFSQYCNQTWGETDNLTLTADNSTHIDVIVNGFNITFQSNTDNWNGTEDITFSLDDNVFDSISSDENLDNLSQEGINSQKDCGRDISQQTVSVTIIPINDPPQVYLPDTFSFAEDGFILIDIYEYCFDLEDDTLSYIAEVGNNLYHDVTLEDELMLTAEANWNGESWLRIFASDNISRLVGIDSTQVIVTPVNDAPMIDLPAEVIYFEEDSSVEYDLNPYVWDIDGDELGISIEDEEILLTGINDLVMTLSALPDWFGSSWVNIFVSDNQNRLIASDSILVEVEQIFDDDPYLEFTEDIILQEDIESIVDFSEYIQNQDNILCELVIEGTEHIFVNIDGFDISLQGATNWYGSENVEFLLTDPDNGNIFSQEVVTIIVEPVNDPPVLSFPETCTFYEDEPYSINYRDYISDVDNETLSIVAGDGENITCELTDSLLTFVPEENWYGDNYIMISVSDDLVRDTTTTYMHIIVQSVNDTPEILLPDEFSFNEDNELEVDFSEYINDIDGDELTLTASNNEDIIVDVTGTIVHFSAQENWYGIESITLTVDDEVERLFSSDSVYVNVLSVNDAPQAVTGDELSADEGSEIVLDGSGSFDVDDDELTFYWDVPEDWEIDDVSAEIAEVILPYVSEDVAVEVILTVQDEAGLESEAQLIVNINDYVDFNPDVLPKVTGLTGVYPNPFNPSTIIRYQLAETEQVNIEVYNIKGQMVTTLFDQEQDAGNYEICWQANDQPSGIYLLRFRAGSYCQNYKVLLLK